MGKPPEFDSLLVFYITSVKVLRDRCIMQMMPLKPKFWKWVAPFAGLGLFIPTVLTSGWFLSHANFGDWLDLWPSSIMFMAIDKPNTPTSTVIFVYALAFAENILLYAAIGAVTWPLACLVLRLYRSHQDIPK